MVAHDGYFYFKREKTQSITVISRIREDGTDFRDVISVDIGSTFIDSFTIANRTLYWLSTNSIRGCALPDCLGGVRVERDGENAIRHLFSNNSRTRLFWTSTVNDIQRLMTNPQNPAVVAVAQTAAPGAADDQFVYFPDEGGSIFRAPVTGGSPVRLGTGSGNLFLNGSHLYSHGTGDVSVGGPWFVAYRLPTTGGDREVIGFQPGRAYAIWGDMAIDDSDAYWAFGTTDGDLSLNRCKLSTTCGTAPRELASGVSYGGEPKGIILRPNVLFFATELGIFKLVK